MWRGDNSTLTPVSHPAAPPPLLTSVVIGTTSVRGMVVEGTLSSTMMTDKRTGLLKNLSRRQTTSRRCHKVQPRPLPRAIPKRCGAAPRPFVRSRSAKLEKAEMDDSCDAPKKTVMAKVTKAEIQRQTCFGTSATRKRFL